MACPGPDAWLLARRSPSDPTDIAYYLSNAPVDTPLLKLAQIVSTRYVVEQLNEVKMGLSEAGVYIERAKFKEAETVFSRAGSLLEQADKLMLFLDPRSDNYRELSKRKTRLWEQLRELWR